MNNISDITVVIPYYNESHVVKYCLDQIAKQTTPAKEAIFINSSSTDGTSDIIDRWIVENQPISVTKFKNFFKNTSNPGSSKNAGINLSTTKWVAFMDCGQIFPTDWLEKQCGYALKNNLDIVYGSVYLAGENWIDRCAVSQTYGYKRPVTCIPSSIVKRSVFTKIGLFLTGKRSGYDVAWRMQVEKNLMKYRTNYDVRIKYRGINFASTLKGVFNKSILYSKPAVNIDGYYVPYFYLLVALFFLFIMLNKFYFSVCLFLIYFSVRSIFIPIVKSPSASFFKEHPFEAVFGLGIVAILIDSGRIYGYILGLIELILVKFKRSR